MKVYSEISDIRRERNQDLRLSWGLVPTMGYLHEGHMSLVARARAENDRVGVSIFVNPIQFNSSEDLASYPSNLERDLELLEKAGVDLVWTPSVDIMYPPNFQTHVTVEALTTMLEGASRPGHFQGVTTVVAKLFNVFQPQRAYFGRKDYQQLVVIKQMVTDLNFPVEVVHCPIVREDDGLAMSSRNVNLSDEGRNQAICLYEALCAAREAIEKGERDADTVRIIMAQIINRNNLAKIDYVSVADSESLEELSEIKDRALLSLAVHVEKVRLIDNMEVILKPL